MNDPQVDGYVGCDECGHMIERHDTAGCNGCKSNPDPTVPCPVTFTQREIGDIRARYGLPRKLSPSFLRP
jgi:hypothetical protein